MGPKDSEETVIEDQSDEENLVQDDSEDNAKELKPDAESDKDPKEDEPEELEIVHTGEDGSQPDTRNTGIRRRINKLNSRVTAAKEQTASKDDELAIVREENKLLQLALEQQQSETQKADIPPDPFDFDEGAGDAGYIKALQTYNQKMVQTILQQQQPAQQNDQGAKDVELDRKQTKHYERADKLGAKDYEDTEDKAIAILGNDVVNQLIKSSENSETILYYLGKNPSKAEYYADLIKANAIQGILEIGALGANLKVKPKANGKPAPNPDEELEGTTTSRKDSKGPAGATYS